MHICQHEIIAFFYAITTGTLVWKWLKAKFHHRKTHQDCEKEGGSK